MKLSFVIPCYRSEHTVSTVIQEIMTTMSARPNLDFEVIAVNDSSPDNVWDVLKNLAENDKRIKAIDFSKNMGKGSAQLAGFKIANGDIVVSLDDDGQCPFDGIWRLLEPIETGIADVSIADFGYKHESAFRNFGSYLNGLMAEMLVGKPRGLKFSAFFAMKRFIVDEVIRYKHPFPYVLGLVLRATSKIINVPIKDRARLSGTSGYTMKKLIGLVLNGFTAFSVKPLRVATFLGLLCSFTGVLYAILTIIRKISHPEIMAGWSSIMSALLVIGGMILFVLGLIGEYVGRIYICINNSPQYVIRETINV